MHLSLNNYSIRVTRIKNILEVVAEIMGFLAGMSFVARMTKHLLTNHKIGAEYDKMY